MPDLNALTIGGASVVTLERPIPTDPGQPAFVRAQILPGRGMMPLQIQAHLPQRGVTSLFEAPPPDKAREILDGESGDFVGNRSYLLGGAILLPYANRIRGILSADGKTIETEILGRRVTLPANAGGRKTGAERYAMHGLILASHVGEVRRRTTDEADSVSGTLQAGDFGGRWLSKTEITFEEVLESDAFSLQVTARNTGSEILPMGIGWHPYFVLPSGRREQARLLVPGRQRVLVNDYDEVLPTGEVVPVAGTPYDFSTPGGRPLGDLYLDDCFVDLERSPEGHSVAEIVDPAASYGLRIVATSPEIRAIQVFAPPDKAFVALEPQLNWADPFGDPWGPDVDTGMVRLEPGESVTYSVRLELFTPKEPLP